MAQLYTIERTFSYEAYADTPGQAMEHFDSYWESGGDQLQSGVTFLQTHLHIYDQEGKEVQP